MSILDDLAIAFLRAEFGRAARASAAIANGKRCGCERASDGDWAPGLRMCDVHERMVATYTALELAREQLGRS